MGDIMTEPTENLAPLSENLEAPKPFVKPAKDEQNGVVRPRGYTMTGRIWEIADALSATKGAPARRRDVIAQAEAEGLHQSTAATQYSRWRKYHGLVGTAPEDAEERARIRAEKAEERARLKEQQKAERKAERERIKAEKAAEREAAKEARKAQRELERQQRAEERAQLMEQRRLEREAEREERARQKLAERRRMAEEQAKAAAEAEAAAKAAAEAAAAEAAAALEARNEANKGDDSGE